MNPLTRLYRCSRTFRVLCYFLMLPAYLLVYLVADNSWERYTEFGTGTLLFLYGAFAVGAWWYAEDCDRQRLASAASVDGTRSPHDNGS